MLLDGNSSLRPRGDISSKMYAAFNGRWFSEAPGSKSEKITTKYGGPGVYENCTPKSLVQCYSVSTGKVSTLLRSPSQSSISSIEVAEINNLSEFMNNSKSHTLDSSSPSSVKFNPIGDEKSVLFTEISEVKVEETAKHSKTCGQLNRSINLQTG